MDSLFSPQDRNGRPPQDPLCQHPGSRDTSGDSWNISTLGAAQTGILFVSVSRIKRRTKGTPTLWSTRRATPCCAQTG